MFNLRWMDRREVVMLNTFLPHGMTESPSSNPSNQRLKPNTVLLYNKTMGGVDNVDKTIKPNQSLRKSYKWYKKVAFYLVELAVYNAMMLHNQVNRERVGFRRLNYEAFLKSIIRDIVEQFPLVRKPKGRPPHLLPAPVSKLHLPERVMKENGDPSKSNCFYCRVKLGKRKITQFRCTGCEKRLCIGDGVNNCFKQHHEHLGHSQVCFSLRIIYAYHIV